MSECIVLLRSELTYAVESATTHKSVNNGTKRRRNDRSHEGVLMHRHLVGENPKRT